MWVKGRTGEGDVAQVVPEDDQACEGQRRYTANRPVRRWLRGPIGTGGCEFIPGA